jgi:hypothetical protein
LVSFCELSIESLGSIKAGNLTRYHLLMEFGTYFLLGCQINITCDTVHIVTLNFKWYICYPYNKRVQQLTFCHGCVVLIKLMYPSVI